MIQTFYIQTKTGSKDWLFLFKLDEFYDLPNTLVGFRFTVIFCNWLVTCLCNTQVNSQKSLKSYTIYNNSFILEVVVVSCDSWFNISITRYTTCFWYSISISKLLTYFASCKFISKLLRNLNTTLIKTQWPKV